MSGSAAADADGGVKKVKVKRQIRCIVKDLEHILGDLKDVAKELKEVVEEIDCLTSDLRLEEDLMDSSNSSSSSSTTTASSVKIYPEETLFRPPAVLKRSSASRAQEIPASGAPLRDSVEVKGHAGRCAQTTRERVRFSEKVQYHGYCPDCDLQCDVDGTDLHLHTGAIDARHSPVHQTLLQNGALAFPSQKPQKTILRKSTSTTV
ncbi:protein Largen-like [Carassius gibelio]|uniref:protein Largen-like n=1 Tax=Carassius gibelio TaxID=101364 RepID=UPI0022798FB6|nr:protein Largen-like [Carassius gibelio]